MVMSPQVSWLFFKARASNAALAELHEIFLGQGGGALELVAGKHYRCDSANAEVRKDGSLAYKITRICLVPYKRPITAQPTFT